MGRFVGIDYGRARIGISLSDERKILASPLLALAVPHKQELLLKELEKTLSPYAPLELFVIGFPLLMNGKEGEMAIEVRAFANILTTHFSVPHVLWMRGSPLYKSIEFLKKQLLQENKEVARLMP